MGVIARRLQDTGDLWRHVYKSLLLLEYMLKHGPQKVASPTDHCAVEISVVQQVAMSLVENSPASSRPAQPDVLSRAGQHYSLSALELSESSIAYHGSA